MVLCISAPHPDESWIALLRDGKPPLKRVVRARANTHGDILRDINILLEKTHASFRDLTAIIVCTGPGHFTFLRTSIVIANMIGWSLRIPVIGLEATNVKEFIAAGLRACAQVKTFSPVTPLYGREPSITQAGKC